MDPLYIFVIIVTIIFFVAILIIKSRKESKQQKAQIINLIDDELSAFYALAPLSETIKYYIRDAKYKKLINGYVDALVFEFIKNNKISEFHGIIKSSPSQNGIFDTIELSPDVSGATEHKSVAALSAFGIGNLDSTNDMHALAGATAIFAKIFFALNKIMISNIEIEDVTVGSNIEIRVTAYKL